MTIENSLNILNVLVAFVLLFEFVRAILAYGTNHRMAEKMRELEQWYEDEKMEKLRWRTLYNEMWDRVELVTRKEKK